jgi:hypothetical protein
MLPTDKPSRLKQNKITKKYSLVTKGIDLTSYIPVNIYITSDEEIKVGDWYINTFVSEREQKPQTHTEKRHLINHQKDYRFKYCKKIILTTDFSLAPDVQKIDDEFLEWFVQNPSCEMVKIEEFAVKVDLLEYKTNYKIIIPKEEKDLTYYKSNAEEDYMHVPISVLRYISELEKALENIGLEEVSGSRHCQFSVVENKLAILYRNQEKILKSIKMINKL